MAVPLVTQWTLVASGIVAHADHVLTGEECERLMAMVDDTVDGEEYGDWMAAIGDAAALQQRLDALPLPPEDERRQILEDAWLMAVVDGRRADEEAAALLKIAERLEVEQMQLDFWREAWTSAQAKFSEASARALRWVLGCGNPLADDDRTVVDTFVGELPTTTEHRDALRELSCLGGSQEEAERALRGLSPTQRRSVVQRLHPPSQGCTDAAAAVDRWRALGRAVRLSDADLDRLAEG